jgi:hypothetical protein
MDEEERLERLERLRLTYRAALKELYALNDPAVKPLILRLERHLTEAARWSRRRGLAKTS